MVTILLIESIKPGQISNWANKLNNWVKASLTPLVLLQINTVCHLRNMMAEQLVVIKQFSDIHRAHSQAAVRSNWRRGKTGWCQQMQWKNSKKDLRGPTHGAAHRWRQASTLSCFTVSKSYNSSIPKQPCLALQPCLVSNTNIFQGIVSKLEMSNLWQH